MNSVSPNCQNQPSPIQETGHISQLMQTEKHSDKCIENHQQQREDLDSLSRKDQRNQSSLGSTFISKMKSLDFSQSFPLLRKDMQSIQNGENRIISQKQTFQKQQQSLNEIKQTQTEAKGFIMKKTESLIYLQSQSDTKSRDNQQVVLKLTQEQNQADFKESQLKKKFIWNLLVIINKNNMKCVKYTFNCFKIEENQNQQSEVNFQFKGFNSTSSKRKSQQSEDFNLQLTMKSKNSKHFPNLSKQDSLMYSNSSFGVNLEHSLGSPLRKRQQIERNQQKYTQSNRNLLKIQDTQQPDIIVPLIKSESKEILESMHFSPNKESIFEQDFKLEIDSHKDNQQSNQIAQSVLLLKVSNEGNNKTINTHNYENPNQNKNFFNSEEKKKDSQKLQVSRLSIESLSMNSNIFSTEISPRQKNTIRIIRQNKQIKKRKLEQEIQRINKELCQIKINENKSSIQQSGNSYSIRLQINEDRAALIRAQGLVRNLRYEKNNRMIAKIDMGKKIDRHIDQYMTELIKLRQSNEDRNKERKKLQILNRMKKKENEKADFIKKKEQNLKFMAHLRVISKSNDIYPKGLKRDTEDYTIELQSPQLFNRKVSLSKARNIFTKKSSNKNYENDFN